jgi:hypothetical protein
MGQIFVGLLLVSVTFFLPPGGNTYFAPMVSNSAQCVVRNGDRIPRKRNPLTVNTTATVFTMLLQILKNLNLLKMPSGFILQLLGLRKN